MDTSATRDPLTARRRFYKGISFGTTLIAIGVVLLLNTMGQLGWSVWLDLIRLWPVLLISIGLRLIFVNTWLHPVSLAGPLLVVLTVVWVTATHSDRAAAAGAWLQSPETITLDCPAPTDSKGSRVTVKFAAGEIRLVSEPAPAGSGPGLKGTLRYEGLEPKRACAASGELRLGRSGRHGSVVLLPPFARVRNEWEARMASSSPVDLDLEIAAAYSEIDLRHMKLKDVDLDLAASSATVRLGAPDGQVPVRIHGAVASLDLILPQAVCFTISRARALNVLKADGVVERRRGRRRLTAQACGAAGSALPAAVPRYEISMDMPLSSVSVETEAGPRL